MAIVEELRATFPRVREIVARMSVMGRSARERMLLVVEVTALADALRPVRDALNRIARVTAGGALALHVVVGELQQTVEVLGRAGCTVELCGHAADHEVVDAVACQRVDDAVRVERRTVLELVVRVRAGRADGIDAGCECAGGSARR